MDGEARATVDGVTETEGFSDWGWVAGAGAEHRITRNISAGVEGLFHRVTNFDGEGVDVDLWTVQARLSYRF